MKQKIKTLLQKYGQINYNTDYFRGKQTFIDDYCDLAQRTLKKDFDKLS